MIARFLYPLVNLIQHHSRRRVASRRVAKDERIIELNLLNQVSRLRVVVIGFSGESDDYISGDGDSLSCLTHAPDKVDIFFGRVSAMHRFENIIGTGLDR